MEHKIFHNNTICCMDDHFSMHLRRPLLETRQKLVSKNQIYSVSEKIRPLCHIDIIVHLYSCVQLRVIGIKAFRIVSLRVLPSGR